jgi:hypothetical protein
MKITKKQLKQLIKEELENVLSEAQIAHPVADKMRAWWYGRGFDCPEEGPGQAQVKHALKELLQQVGIEADIKTFCGSTDMKMGTYNIPVEIQIILK